MPKFVEQLAPPLQAGTYRVSVKPTIRGKGIPENAFAENYEFIHVGGKRFNIDAADIDSVYPPANGNGKYAEVLPHIVFSRPGLPWERSPKKNESVRRSWLALLVFHQDDPAPTVKQISLGALKASAEDETNGIWLPALELEPGESPNDTCQYIDLPQSLFLKIAPGLDDLKWVAHARILDTLNKANGNLKSEDHTYSVVIGNRTPEVGKESVVHLASLENYGALLKGEVPEEDYHTVRLVSLRNWRFTCEDTGGSFAGHFENLNGGGLMESVKEDTSKPLFLQLPFSRPAGGQSTAVYLLRQGFLPMEHKFRQGLKSISWYRGPFVPLMLPTFISLPVASADALLVYDPRNGYYDVSYAAAWQLGQLLGLKNKDFAKQLYFWKYQKSIDERKEQEQDLLVEKLTIEPSKDGKMLLPEFGKINGSIDNKAQEQEAGAATQSTDTLHGAMEEPKINPGLREEAKEEFGADIRISEALDIKIGEATNLIQRFILELRTLKGVPFNYLIADPRMLAPESIRFFFVDPNWVKALVDGAFSLGDLVSDHDKNSTKKSEPQDEEGSILTGFLLRSSIVTTWPGIEIEVKDIDGKRLDFVRHERLAEDLILSIVEGRLCSLEFRKPVEGLHFSVGGEQGKVDLQSIADEKGVKNSAAFAKEMVQQPELVSITLKKEETDA